MQMKVMCAYEGCDPRQMRWHDTLISTSTEHTPSPPLSALTHGNASHQLLTYT